MTENIFEQTNTADQIISGFTPTQNELEQGYKSVKEISAEFRKEIESIWALDYKVRIKARIWLSLAFSILLIVQNVGVFYIIWHALNLEALANLQLIFAALTAATLYETYKVIYIIVNWVFKDNDYDRAIRPKGD